MKNAIALTLAAVALAACSTTNDKPATLATAPSFNATHVTAVGTTPIKPSRQPAFCQDQVAYTYEAERQNVTTHERVVGADGGATIDVTVDKGGTVKTFKCRFDDGNRFVEVTAGDGMS
jgi:curli biogenesis system outer membrane secretion channel CsgG